MLWDCADSNVFALFDNNNIHCYVYRPVTINGPTITELCVQPKGAGLSPIVLSNGQLTGQLKNGSLEVVPLESHRGLQVGLRCALSRCRSCPVAFIDVPAGTLPLAHARAV